MTAPAPPSEKEPAVFDASPLIFFDVLGYAERLPELHRILVPPAVTTNSPRYPKSPVASFRQRAGSNSGHQGLRPCEESKVR
jgi:hypothetical protein